MGPQGADLPRPGSALRTLGAPIPAPRVWAGGQRPALGTPAFSPLPASDPLLGPLEPPRKT